MVYFLTRTTIFTRHSIAKTYNVNGVHIDNQLAPINSAAPDVQPQIYIPERDNRCVLILLL